MMGFLQTGRVLYVLAVICFGGIFVRLAAGSFYKKLIKESANMALTKNRYLRNLKQNAEDTYRINMGMNNAAVYLQRQLGNLKFLGFSLSGLENLAGQLTLLSFLAGGVCAFLSYWNRSDNSYIVLYGAAGILGGMLTIVADYGVNLEGKRNQLLISLQDHLENVMWPRLERESSSERASAVTEAEERRDGGTVRTIGRDRDRRLSGARRGAEQTAASRENAREALNRDKKEDRSAKDWLDDLNPEQKRMLGEMLKEFL